MYITGSQFYAQQQTETSDFLYKQLDYFLETPTRSGALRLSKIIVSKEKLLTKDTDKLAWVIVHCNLGFYQNQFGNKDTAILYYERAWKTYNDNHLKNYDIIENCLQPLGNLYIQIGDLPKAEHTITNYLYLAEQSKKNSKIISAFTNLSIAYNNQGKHQKAIEILKKGENSNPKNTNILINLATNYLDIDSLKQSRRYALKAISLDSSQTNAFQILAAISLKKNDIKNAQRYIQKAEYIILKNPNISSRDIAKLYLGYIDILLSTHQYTEVLLQLKQIYTLLLPRYKPEKEYPDKEILIADKVLLQTLDLHAFVYEQIKKQELAVHIYTLAYEVNSKLNTIYPLLDTKIIQHNQHRNRTESHLKLLYSLYNKTQNKEYILQAFKVAEQSKAPFVNEALVSKQLLSSYNNDSLVIEAKQLTYELATNDTYILKEKLKGDGANIAQMQKWNSIYNSTSIALKEVTKKLKDQYPDLLRATKDISIESLQKKVKKDNTTILSYFYGSTIIFQFEITSENINIKPIPKTEDFEKKMIDYINYFNNAATINNDIKQFSNSSLDAFTTLKIPTDRNKILIIPDGLLNFIPFETLVTKKSNSINFRNIPFLIRSSEISYEISIHKYFRSNSNHLNKNTILGVFPVFENTALELPNSIAEKSFIQEEFEGVFLEKKEATYHQFLATAKTQNILHLSTHAEGGSFSRPASIKFRDQDVIINQLRGLQLQAELVVLSACETGIGKLTKGEGPLSISRAFQYAGIKNTLFSLWKVNDRSTSQLMQQFYQNFKTLGSASSSLHKAKLEYLDTEIISNAQKSPYYWAAFVYYGDIAPISNRNYTWKIALGVFLLIIVFLLATRQKKQ